MTRNNVTSGQVCTSAQVNGVELYDFLGKLSYGDK